MITVISLLREPLKVQRREGYTGMAIIQQALRHTVWECKYHIVWIPKYRKKRLWRNCMDKLDIYTNADHPFKSLK